MQFTGTISQLQAYIEATFQPNAPVIVTVNFQVDYSPPVVSGNLIAAARYAARNCPQGRSRKIEAIKAVREAAGPGVGEYGSLKGAKDFVEANLSQSEFDNNP